VLAGLAFPKNERLLWGIETSDDAGVYKITEDLALIQTLDFFTPIVDDPFEFGRIAAANSLSDVYAMGGRPITAMNIVCFPVKTMDRMVLRAILEGGIEVISKAGAVLAGGHSVEDSEIKYGLSVTGVVHPDRFLTNAGARAGDVLVLTKPLGTGILSTALKAGLLDEKTTRRLIWLMAELNKDACEAMKGLEIHACTDITGFGLLGHALEMATASKTCFIIHSDSVPVLEEAHHFASMGFVPEGSHANQKFCGHQLEAQQGIDPVLLDILADAQTSGGLLVALSGEHAKIYVDKLCSIGVPACHVIGEVIKGQDELIKVTR